MSAKGSAGAMTHEDRRAVRQAEGGAGPPACHPPVARLRRARTCAHRAAAEQPSMALPLGRRGCRRPRIAVGFMVADVLRARRTPGRRYLLR